MPSLLFSFSSLFFLSLNLEQAKHAAIADIVHELTALLEAGKDVNLNALKQEVRMMFWFSINHSTARKKKLKNLFFSPPFKKPRPRPATPSPRPPSS